MNKLRAIELFVRLADLGSFTLVAEEKNSSKSMISKEISRLEDDIGARLLQRSTRNVRLTQVGQGYLKRCREILLKFDEADEYVQELQNQPKGKLKIAVPMALGLIDLSQMFSDFMRAYPDIELDIHLGDEPIKLLEQGFDVAFRAASTSFDSNFVGRVLTRFSYHICASPSYLRSHPEITVPDDLKNHNCFVYSYFRGKNVWPIGDGVTIQGALRVNSTIFMLEVVKNGLGVGFIPDFVCRDALEKGDVVSVLPELNKPYLDLYVLYPVRDHMPSNLKICIEFLDQWFKKNSTRSD